MVRSNLNAETAGHVLRDLLIRNAQYRTRWKREVKRERGELNQAAVAQVITDFSWENQHQREISDARALKDLVRRAFTGEHLTLPTLALFIAAFDMDDADSDRLWRALTGPDAAVPRTAARTPPRGHEMIFPQRHRTMNLVERYVVEEGRYLRSRHTTQTIRAVEDNVWFYLFNHEPEARGVDVLHGGRPGRSHEYGSGLRGIEIELERPLRQGETAALDYRTHFGGRRTHRTEVRRPVHARVENVDVAVAFTGQPPRRVWWCVWTDHLADEPAEQLPIRIDGGTARCFVSSLDAEAGFRWVP